MRPSPAWLLKAAVGLVYLFVLGPIAIIVMAAFDPSTRYNFPPSGLSLRWFKSFFETEAYVQSFLHVSLPTGLVVSLVATALGTMAAMGIARGRGRTARVVEVFFLAPLLLPELLLAVSWYIVSAKAGLTGSMAAVIMGHIVIATPFVIRNVTAGLSGFDSRLEEAAASLGAAPWRTFRLVTLPLLRSSVLSGMVFAFIISFSDINVSLFLAGPGATTLPVHIFAQIQFEDDPTVAAASALQVLLIAGLLLVLQRMFKVRFA